MTDHVTKFRSLDSHEKGGIGGTGLSGHGREMGFEAMHEYTEAKSIWINVDAQLAAWYPR